MTLTGLEFEVLAEITVYRLENHYSPSIQDIADRLYISKACCHKYFYRLYFKGAVTMIPKVSRTVVPTEAGIKYLESF